MVHITSLAKICIFPYWVLTDSDEELTLELSKLFTVANLHYQLCWLNQNILLNTPPTQHHSSFRNLSPWSNNIEGSWKFRPFSFA